MENYTPPPSQLINVYPNGDIKKFEFKDKNKLKKEIEYNLEHRPGRAMIVDGKIIYKGIGVDKDMLRMIKLDHFSPLNTL